MNRLMNKSKPHQQQDDASSAAASSPASSSSYKYLGKGLDYDLQSIPYKDDQSERISKLLDNNRQLCRYQYEQVLTMNDIFLRGSQQTKDGKCLGQLNMETGKIDWISYMDVLRRTKLIGDGIKYLLDKHEDAIQDNSQKSIDSKTMKALKQKRIGIYSKNYPEYVLVEYGSYRHSIIVIPIYDTLGPNIASYISNQTKLNLIACDNLERIEKILKEINCFINLKYLILLKQQNQSSMMINDDLRQRASSKGIEIFSLTEIESLGEKNPQEDHKPTVNDLAMICYTSGTTGDPKGVMLTHENIISSISTISIHLMEHHATPDDIMISILPLAHMFQRIGEASVFTEGGKVAYYSGDIRKIAQEIVLIRPTIMLAVPRLLNRLYDAIQARVRRNLLKKTILQLAYRNKRKYLLRHMIYNNTIWDRFVFNQIREQMGSRIRLICVGAAPLSSEILDFLRVVLGCIISEGYGQTECVGPCTATLIGDYTTNHIGPPLVGSIVKLSDVPEMEYYSKQMSGEILVKGPTVFQGYFSMPERTRETIDSDGWLHTGDIGYWTKQGTLKLIDRKKNIFKLSQGEYIAPEKIENILINSKFIQQIFIYGDGFKSMLIAIIVPDLDFIDTLELSLNNLTNENDNNDNVGNDNSLLKNCYLRRFLMPSTPTTATSNTTTLNNPNTGTTTTTKQSIKDLTEDELNKFKKLKKLILDDFKSIGMMNNQRQESSSTTTTTNDNDPNNKTTSSNHNHNSNNNNNLKPFEIPKNLYIKRDPFTIEDGFLTPTLKIKRKVVEQYYAKQIKNLYKELDKMYPPDCPPSTKPSTTAAATTTTTNTNTKNNNSNNNNEILKQQQKLKKTGPNGTGGGAGTGTIASSKPKENSSK